MIVSPAGRNRLFWARQGTLLAVELGKKGFHYPVWQLDLPEFDTVLAELRQWDAWTQLSFFLNPHGLLEGKTPLAVLRGSERAQAAAAGVKAGGRGAWGARLTALLAVVTA